MKKMIACGIGKFRYCKLKEQKRIDTSEEVREFASKTNIVRLKGGHSKFLNKLLKLS